MSSPSEAIPGQDDQPTWELSHLPPLTSAEQTALIDILQAWFAQRSWSLPSGCRAALVWDYAERHGLSGALGALAMAGKVTHESLSAQAKDRYLSNLLFHQQCHAICARLHAEAARQRIPMAIMKGPALADAYEDPGVRAYADVDVFVNTRDDAWTLIRTLDYSEAVEAAAGGIRDRFNESGRIHVHSQGWEFEFCHQVHPPGDPLFDLMESHAERILQIPDGLQSWSVVDPSAHLVFLIQHMARHLCARLIWFVDLAVLARHYRTSLDMDWVATELDRLQVRNLAAEIARFCTRHIDPAFPAIAPGPRGWNHRFQQAMTSVETVAHGHVSLFHRSGWRKYFAYILSPARFFLITDPASHSVFCSSRAGHWSAARLLYTIRWNNRLAYHLLDKFIVLCYPALLRPVARIAVRPNREPRSRAADRRTGF